ncbi:TadE/TadG family type IV pilus assembly protein [Vreelandella zhanjiangensis]|uniref:TadE/TadG family type IV pilus assembly protein n=1 Tax=Vreelandella zhanjiangensis TaxID=1121960 RepID=UPI0003730E29|nr:TadE/TadG family type IV pilus assembly protein [Halomonas zhanjiangensis]
MSPLSLQKGAASIEFALSFIILLMLFYGIAGFSMPLLMSASYQQLASDTLREGLAWQHYRHTSDTEVQTYVASLIEEAWMPSQWAQPCEGNSQFLNIEQASGIWQVCLRHPSPSSILPPIRLLGWEFPPLPDQIVGFAILHTREVAP